ncbi:MAG: efflux transporter outer membrane subunit [Parabacteroides sp.]|nr:efflux transporter outer membrane subunit [Parabacteroides sp.]
MRYIIMICVSSILLLSSCKIGKRYARPELGLPDRIEARTDTTDTTSVTSIPWESLYADDTLKGLIMKALDNNKDMRIAAAKIKEMIAAKRISFASMLPEVGASLYAQKERQNYGGDNPKPDPEFGAKLTLSWELDLWGNLRWANEATIASYMQTVEGQRALRLTIIAEVAANYYQLCALDQELSIVQQTLEARREGVRLAKLRYEGGLTSETAYNQALVELARTETLIPSLERQIKIKESDLSLLLGEYTSDIPRGLSLGEQRMREALPVGLPSSLLERRPDMRQAEFKLQAANALVGVAQTDLFPKIRLTSSYGFESDELGNLLKSSIGFIAGSLLQPIFAMGKNKAKVKAAKARYEQEVYGYEKSVLEAFKEVNNAIVTVRKVKEVRASRSNLEASARKYLELAQLQYINGVINYMDVLDAQRGLLDAQIGLNNAVLDELLSVVYLYKALGGGF